MTQIIWQIYTLGDASLQSSDDIDISKALVILLEKLREFYPASHQIIIYEAKTSPVFSTRIETISLGSLVNAQFSAVSTLVIPSLGLPEYNDEVLKRLGIEHETFEQHYS